MYAFISLANAPIRADSGIKIGAQISLSCRSDATRWRLSGCRSNAELLFPIYAEGTALLSNSYAFAAILTTIRLGIGDPSCPGGHHTGLALPQPFGTGMPLQAGQTASNRRVSLQLAPRLGLTIRQVRPMVRTPMAVKRTRVVQRAASLTPTPLFGIPCARQSMSCARGGSRGCASLMPAAVPAQIGRASCRARV